MPEQRASKQNSLDTSYIPPFILLHMLAYLYTCRHDESTNIISPCAQWSIENNAWISTWHLLEDPWDLSTQGTFGCSVLIQTVNRTIFHKIEYKLLPAREFGINICQSKYLMKLGVSSWYFKRSNCKLILLVLILFLSTYSINPSLSSVTFELQWSSNKIQKSYYIIEMFIHCVYI